MPSTLPGPPFVLMYSKLTELGSQGKPRPERPLRGPNEPLRLAGLGLRCFTVFVSFDDPDLDHRLHLRVNMNVEIINP